MRRYPYDYKGGYREPLLMVVQGDPVEGYKLHGPFIDAKEAAEYAEGKFGPNGWSLMVSSPPTR